MIIGTGIDIVEIDRIEKLYSRYGEKFLKKFLRAEEITAYSGKRFIQFLAGRWAAKEAFWKAAGCRGMFSPLSIVISSGNKPSIAIYSKKIRSELEKRGMKRIHLSISHERNYAVAMVIIEGGET